MDQSIDSKNERKSAEYNPSRVILLSELSTRDKERYYTLLLTHQAKFRKETSNSSSGLFVADLRILAPTMKKSDYQRKYLGDEKDSQTSARAAEFSWGREDRIRRLLEDGYVQVQIIGVEEFEYNTYTKFAALISNHGDMVKPKPRNLSWVMKTIEDVYDARFAQEKLDVEREDDQISLPSESNNMFATIFPFFALKHLATVVGMSKILDKTCWDLIYNVHRYRREYIEVEAFARFLQEFYNHDDLLFYLYVRNVIGNLLHVNFKLRWAKSDGPGRLPKVLWMSYRECVYVAKSVFGAGNEALYKDFLNIIIPQMVGQKTSSVDSRRIDIAQYLHLAVVGYHQTQDGGSSLSPPPGGMTNTSMMAENERKLQSETMEDRDEREDYQSSTINEVAYGEQDVEDMEVETIKEARKRPSVNEGAGFNKQVPQGDYDASFDTMLAAMMKEREGNVDQYDDGNYEKSTLEGLASEDASPAYDHGQEKGRNKVSPMKTKNNDVSFNRQPQVIDTDNNDNDEEEDDFASLQVAREKEFMAYLAEPLTVLPDDVAEYIVNEIAVVLRQHVNEALDQFPDDEDIDEFDGHLLYILQDAELKERLESFRDELLKQVLDGQSGNSSPQ